MQMIKIKYIIYHLPHKVFVLTTERVKKEEPCWHMKVVAVEKMTLHNICCDPASISYPCF